LTHSAHPAFAGLPIVLGGNVFGWSLDEAASFAVLDAFYAAGGRMIDTAEGYSNWVPGNKGGESEAIIGAWLESRGCRTEMRIATKTGMDGNPGDLAPGRIATAIEGSLARLRTDYVDLYYAHRDDSGTPLADTITAFDALVKGGKARSLGASNHSAARLAEARSIAQAQGLTPYSVVQPEYNLIARGGFAVPLQQLCVDEGVIAFPYYGLASGFLTGKYRSADDAAKSNARGKAAVGLLDERGLAMLGAMDVISSETGASLAQIALAWLIGEPGIAAPIASATTPAQVEELIGAAKLTLTAEQHARLSAI
jgi:aryl-alcohol dehydrogenase-like predicted oxidoreductase